MPSVPVGLSHKFFFERAMRNLARSILCFLKSSCSVSVSSSSSSFHSSSLGLRVFVVAAPVLDGDVMATSFVLRSTALLEAAAGTGALLAGLLILLVPVLVIFDVVVLRSPVVPIFVLP